MIKLTIDNKTVNVTEGATILEAAKTVGIDIPHFCYHPLLSVAGNCRVCAVEVKGFANPVISCREKVKDGMVVLTESALAEDARRSALEFILTNHPLDCPVCDCAGECDLQDYYFEYSRQPSRFNESKIRKSKIVDAGDHIILDAQRCISCTKCIRFCEEIAGCHEIGIIGRGAAQEISTDGRLNNNYSLCTVDICPVGALTQKEFRFKKRVWMLESAPSICMGCSTGCNIWIDHEGRVPYRIRPRENDDINKSWMCDFGRSTFERIVASNRVLKPFVAEDGCRKDVSWNDALGIISRALSADQTKKISMIISAALSCEDGAAFADLAKKMSAEEIYLSSMAPDYDFADNFLRSSDRNPNQGGIKSLATRSMSQMKSDGGVCIVAGNVSDVEIVKKSGFGFVAYITTHCDDPWADVTLPLAMTCETGGTVVNKDGISQRVDAIFAPADEAKSGAEIANGILP